MQRLQKERDSFQEEMEKMHERLELQQNQLAKMQRDKENLLSELDLVKERWEKAHNTHQKLTVRGFSSTVAPSSFRIYVFQREDMNSKTHLLSNIAIS